MVEMVDEVHKDATKTHSSRKIRHWISLYIVEIAPSHTGYNKTDDSWQKSWSQRESMMELEKQIFHIFAQFFLFPKSKYLHHERISPPPPPRKNAKKRAFSIKFLDRRTKNKASNQENIWILPPFQRRKFLGAWAKNKVLQF